MKIVLVMDQYDDSSNGTTVTARRMAQNLRNAGHTVTILAGGRPEEGKICARKHTVPVFQKLVESQGMCFAKPDAALYYEAFKDADVVHFFMPFRFCREGEKYARQMRVPTLGAFHIQPENITSTLYLNQSGFVNRALYRWFYRRFYNRFDHIHCPSEFIAGQLAANGYAAKTHVISNGVSRAFRPLPAAKPPEWQGKLVVLMIGRLSREKRQDLLIDAVAQSKYADRIQLVFAGKGPREKALKKRAAKLPNPPVMQFYSQQELLNVINCSDLYVHASDAEIEGISCLEAMACGLVPVISDSKLSATGQYALHPNSLFCAGDSKDLARKIDFWLDNPAEKREMAARYGAQQEGNRVDLCAAKMEALYEEAIKTARTKRPPEIKPAWWKRPFIPRRARVNSRLHSKNRLAAAFTRAAGTAAGWVLWPLLKIFFGFRVKGRRNLRGLEEGAVTVCNHIHPLDCAMIKTAVGTRGFWIASLGSNFEMPLVGGLVKGLGAFSVSGGPAEYASLNRALARRIEAGDMVHYYPEGMLVPYYGGLRECHGGAFALAVQAGCPVVPMVLCREQRGGLYRLKRKPCLTLHVLHPVWPDAALAPRAARQKLLRQTEFCMQAVLNEPFTQQPARVYRSWENARPWNTDEPA